MTQSIYKIDSHFNYSFLKKNTLSFFLLKCFFDIESPKLEIPAQWFDKYLQTLLALKEEDKGHFSNSQAPLQYL